jgi:hypothetical protein
MYESATRKLMLNVVAANVNTNITSIGLYCQAGLGVNSSAPPCLSVPLSAGLHHSVTAHLSPAAAADFEGGLSYVGVATVEYPMGELRGAVPLLNSATQTMPNMVTTMRPVFGTNHIGHAFFWYQGNAMDYQIYHTVNSDAATVVWMNGKAGQTGTEMGVQPSNPSIGQLGGASMPAFRGTVSGLGTATNQDGSSVSQAIEALRFQCLVRTTTHNPELLGHVYPYGVGIILTSEFRQLGARLHPNQRGAVGTKVTVAVSLPSTAVGNEIQVTLPKGFMANEPAATAVEWPVGIDAPASVYAEGQTVQLRYPEAGPVITDPHDIRFTITNLKAPMACKDEPYKLETKTCRTTPLYGTPITFRNCSFGTSNTTFRMEKATGTGVPHECGACDACEFAYRSSTGEDMYICYHEDFEFHRVIQGPLDAPCHNTNPAIAACGGNPANLAVGCTV